MRGWVVAKLGLSEDVMKMDGWDQRDCYGRLKEGEPTTLMERGVHLLRAVYREYFGPQKGYQGERCYYVSALGALVFDLNSSRVSTFVLGWHRKLRFPGMVMRGHLMFVIENGPKTDTAFMRLSDQEIADLCNGSTYRKMRITEVRYNWDRFNVPYYHGDWAHWHPNRSWDEAILRWKEPQNLKGPVFMRQLRHAVNLKQIEVVWRNAYGNGRGEAWYPEQREELQQALHRLVAGSTPDRLGESFWSYPEAGTFHALLTSEGRKYIEGLRGRLTQPVVK